MPRIRTKPCDLCGSVADVLFRVRRDAAGEWIFVCEGCHGEVSRDNPDYRYGGTWKSRKRR